MPRKVSLLHSPEGMTTACRGLIHARGKTCTVQVVACQKGTNPVGIASSHHVTGTELLQWLVPAPGS